MRHVIGIFLLLACGYAGKAQTFNPVLNDAFVLPKGVTEITAGYSALGLSYDGESEGYYNSLDFQLGYGLSRRVSLVARYEKSWIAKQMFEEPAFNFLYVGPEISLKENRLSLFIPFGGAFAEGSDGFMEITPSLNATLPIGSKVFFNPAVELGFIFCEYCESSPYLGLNLGISVRPLIRSLSSLNMG